MKRGEISSKHFALGTTKGTVTHARAKMFSHRLGENLFLQITLESKECRKEKKTTFPGRSYTKVHF
jgi:hypothetical protein